MAKSQRKSMKARSTVYSSVVPLRARIDQVVAVVNLEQQAQAIVAQLLAHFGAGYGAERQNETPGDPPINADIFIKPSVCAAFHGYLLNSTVTNFLNIHWDNPAVRAQTLIAAFKHGVLARQLVVSEETGALTLAQIFVTLEAAKQFCPSGSGGGGACD